MAFIRTLQHGFPAQKVGAAHLGGLEASNAAAVEVVEDEPIVSLLLFPSPGGAASEALACHVLCRY